MNPEGRLLIGAVGLVKGRVANLNPVLTTLAHELQPVLQQNGWFHDAPFTTINLIIRLGSESAPNPELRPIIKRYNELPAAVYVSMDEARRIARTGGDLIGLLRGAVIEGLRAVARRYKLVQDGLEPLSEVN
jgi:hypothetical protein